MRNKPYPLYDLPPITDLKDLITSRYDRDPESNAFSYSAGKDKTVVKTTVDVFVDVNAFGTYLLSCAYNDKHIAIIGENSYEWIVSFLAIANSGNVVVPIDKESSAEAVRDMIGKSNCEAAVVSGTYYDLVEGLGITVYSMKCFLEYLEAGKKMIADGDTRFIDYKIEPDKMAAIFFTSGTTGSGKCVMLSHKNIASDINAACRNFVLEGDTLSVLPFHHTFGLLTAIFCVFNYDKSTYITKSLKRLKQDLASANPQMMFMVPLFIESFYKQIMDSINKQGKTKKFNRAIKISNVLLHIGIDLRRKIFKDILDVFGGNIEYIICGGAPLDSKYVKMYRSWGISILNGYGITECSPVVAVNRNNYWKDGSVGLVIDKCQVQINENKEILVKGDNVMLGYYNENFDDVLSEGWYHTGDIGYIDDQGFLFVTGRMKNLIVLSNGENISPEEIENRIIKYDAVNEVVVYDDNGKIIAEIYPNEQYADDETYFNEMLKKINHKQPIYKQVNSIKLRNTPFEKNTNQKILRHKIKEDNNHD